MPSLVLSYAPADEPQARAIGGFLSANLPVEVSYGECVITPELDLIDAAERALSGDIALILLSESSVPKTWRRDRWAPVFFDKPAEFETRVGFVLLNACRFPDLLRREKFFDLSIDFREGTRQLKRWLLRPEQPYRQSPATIDPLYEQLADQPGVAIDIHLDRALQLTAACESDFAAIYRINAHGRTIAGIVGDLGHAMSLALPGTVEQNIAAIGRNQNRFLLICENVPPQFRNVLIFGERASVIFTNPSPPLSATAEQIGHAFFASPRDPEACAALLPQATALASELLPTDFESGLRLGWALVSVLKHQQRFAEAVETLHAMETAARQRGDALALFRVEWEQSWLSDTEADRTICILPTASPETVQLSLAFA